MSGENLLPNATNNAVNEEKKEENKHNAELQQADLGTKVTG